MNDTPTPRTDLLVGTLMENPDEWWKPLLDHARQLEREMAEATTMNERLILELNSSRNLLDLAVTEKERLEREIRSLKFITAGVQNRPRDVK